MTTDYRDIEIYDDINGRHYYDCKNEKHISFEEYEKALREFNKEFVLSRKKK